MLARMGAVSVRHERGNARVRGDGAQLPGRQDQSPTDVSTLQIAQHDMEAKEPPAWRQVGPYAIWQPRHEDP